MDGKLEYLITADASKLISEIGSSLSALGSLSAKIAGMGALAGLGAMGAGIGIGTKIAADRESVKIAFKNIIGDAKEADAVLAQLFKYADSTPFQIDEIVAAAKVLAASGFQAKELGSEIAALGNIAAATGGDLKSLAIVYGQVASAGKLMGQDMLQFINQGAGEVKAQIARTMGVSKEELAGLQEQGAITFDILKKSVHDLAGEQGKWGHTTKELAASTAGLFSTMEDAIKGALNELGKPINDAIKPVLTSATGLAEGLKATMRDLGENVASVITAMHKFVTEAGAGGGLAKGLMQAMANAFNSIWDYVEPVLSAIGTVAVGIGSSLLTALEPFGKALFATFEAAGHAMKAMLLDTLSSLPGMGHLKEQSQDESRYARMAVMRSKANLDDAPDAAQKGLSQFSDAIDKAREQVKQGFFKADVKAYGKDIEAEKKAAEQNEAAKQLQDFNAALAGAKQAAQNARPSGAFGSDDPAAKKQSDKADADKRAAEEAKRKAAADAKGAQAATQRAAADSAVMKTMAGPAKDAKSRIQGWSQARENSGDYARHRWDRLNGAEKQRYGNNAANYARGHSTRLDDIEGNNGWNWGGKRMAASMLTRANQAVAGGMGAVPAQPHQRPAAPPIAQTQDSTSRVLLQNILAQLKQMSTHLGNLTKG